MQLRCFSSFHIRGGGMRTPVWRCSFTWCRIYYYLFSDFYHYFNCSLAEKMSLFFVFRHKHKCSPRFPKHNQVTWLPLCSRDVPNHVLPPWKYQLRWDEDLTRWTVQKIIKFEKRRNLPPCSRSCNAAFATPTLEQKKMSQVIYHEKKIRSGFEQNFLINI